jgi:hypothetical protein
MFLLTFLEMRNEKLRYRKAMILNGASPQTPSYYRLSGMIFRFVRAADSAIPNF